MFTEVRQMAARAITRLNNILCRGILYKVTSAKTPTAKVTLYGGETYEGIEFAQDWGFISSPPIDGSTEVLVAFFGGQRDAGTVLKSLNKTKSLKANSSLDLEEGECAIYNKVANTYILLKADGTILIKTEATEGITIDAQKVTMTGDLFVEGDIIDNSESNTTDVQEMRQIFNSHVHSGVAAGGANSGESTTEM